MKADVSEAKELMLRSSIVVKSRNGALYCVTPEIRGQSEMKLPLSQAVLSVALVVQHIAKRTLSHTLIQQALAMMAEEAMLIEKTTRLHRDEWRDAVMTVLVQFLRAEEVWKGSIGQFLTTLLKQPNADVHLLPKSANELRSVLFHRSAELRRNGVDFRLGSEELPFKKIKLWYCSPEVCSKESQLNAVLRCADDPAAAAGTRSRCSEAA